MTQLNSKGMPDVCGTENQIVDGLPAERLATKRIDEEVNRIM